MINGNYIELLKEVKQEYEKNKTISYNLYKTIDTFLIKEFRLQSIPINIDNIIIETISNYYKITDYKKRSRLRPYVMTRHFMSYFLYIVYNRKSNFKSLHFIEKILDRDHATILYSCKTIKNLISVDKSIKEDFEIISREIEHKFREENVKKNVQLEHQILKDDIYDNIKFVNNIIIETISSYYNITDIKSKNHKDIIPKYFICHFLYKEYNPGNIKTLTDVGNLIGRSPSSVIYSCDKIKELVKEHSIYESDYITLNKEIKKRITNGIIK